MRTIRTVLAVGFVVLILAVGYFIFSWRPAIDPEPFAQHATFDPALVASGASLVNIGNCISCHTAPGDAAFAGGVALPTPFGTIHSTNITPDPTDGIGDWSEAAFRRALRQGVDREGNHLYPAFPYDHYTKVTDADIAAIYAFLMTRKPVKGGVPANDLVFPLNFRPVLAGWKLLFFTPGVFQPDPARSEEFNRGAYLAEGLGHCGSCHTPRNSFGAEDTSRHFDGGEAEGWQAYAIDENSPAPVPWEKEALAFYLKHGYHALHGVSRGPMAEVTGNLAGLADADAAALAAYVIEGMGAPSPEQVKQGEALKQTYGKAAPGAAIIPIDENQSAQGGKAAGESVFQSACATCHETNRPQPFGGLNFNLSTAVNAPDPQNIINVTLFGLPPADGEANAIMPGFAGVLDDRQMADLLHYMRGRYTGKVAWEGVEDQVRRTRSGNHPITVRPAGGIERAPFNAGAKEGS